MVESLRESDITTEIVWDPKEYKFDNTENEIKKANTPDNEWSPDDPKQSEYQNRDNWEYTDTTYEDVGSSRTADNNWLTVDEYATTSAFNIRNLVSNESDIPDSEKGEIIRIINNLSDFEKIIIVGCTDGSPINTEQAKRYNQNKFEEIRTQYIQAGWTCPQLKDLLSDNNDPQNKVLWYRRAMEWVLSLNLNQNQIKKVKIDAKPWNNLNDPNERGFDINIDYSDMTTEIGIEVWNLIQKIYWDLVDQDFGTSWSEWNYEYVLRTTKFSTDVQNLRTQLYQQLLGNLWNNVNSEDSEKKAFIDREVRKYLGVARFLIPYYDSANWLTHESEKISRKDYYLIKLSKQLNKDEFQQVLEWGPNALNIIWNKTLKDQKDEKWNPITVNDFVKNNNINAVDNSCLNWDANPYHYKNGDTHNRAWRRLSKDDYILLGMYFELQKN